MAHSHAHAEAETGGTFFLDQLFTILLSGGVGLVAVLMYQTGTLDRILVPMFFVPVLIGGTAILLMTAIRAVAVWKLAGARQLPMTNAEPTPHVHDENCGHDHGHSHGEECGHDHSLSHSHSHAHSHAHDAHSHGEGEAEEHHDHGWAPWKYMILAVPVFLYFLGFPRAGIGNPDQKFGKAIEKDQRRQALSMLVGPSALTRVLKKADQQEFKLGFQTLSNAAVRTDYHSTYDGETGILRGQFMPLSGSDREFTLFRVDRTCCYADQTYLQMRVEAPEPVQIDREEWIMVKGDISFRKNDKGAWIPVITLKSNEDITRNIEPVPNVRDF